MNLFSTGKNTPLLPAWLRLLRPQQWSKNILIFVPVITAQAVTQSTTVNNALIAFVAFSLCASSVYIINDISDREADKAHPTKRFRPIAAGIIPPRAALLLSAILISISLWLSMILGRSFVLIILLYALITTLYSVYFKQIALLDVLLLASLYSLRIFAGAVATSIPVSYWLIVFSMFFFFQLAVAKRSAELKLMQTSGQQSIARRGYTLEDLPLLMQYGISSGYGAIIVFILYINSTIVGELYSTPILLWAVALIIFYWIHRLWLLIERGITTEDPLTFALKDSTSYALAVATGILLFSAA